MILPALIFLSGLVLGLGLHFGLANKLPELPQFPKHDSLSPETRESYLTMFGFAHDDIWWAKEHAWTIALSGLALPAAILVGNLPKADDADRLLLSVFLVIVNAAIVFYIGRMQSDMAVARIRSAFIVQRVPELCAVVRTVVGNDRLYNCGAHFMLALVALPSLAAGGSVQVLHECAWVSCVIFAALFSAGSFGLYRQTATRAANEHAISGKWQDKPDCAA